MSLLNPSRTGTDWAKLYVIVFSVFLLFTTGILTFFFPRTISQLHFLILLVLECSLLGLVISETKNWLLLGVMYTGIIVAGFPVMGILFFLSAYDQYGALVGVVPIVISLLFLSRFVSVFVVYRWTETSGESHQAESRKSDNQEVEK